MKISYKTKIIFFITSLSLLFCACDGIITRTASFDRIQKREMVPITGGTYIQTDGTNSFTHNISSFRIAKYEVTYELWWAVYQWGISHGYIFGHGHAGMEGSQGNYCQVPTAAKYEPVTCVTWSDAIVWCNAYSEAADLTPCYKFGGIVIKDSSADNATACDNAVCDWAVNGFRLPTEGEWQFAASNKGATPYNYLSGATTYYDDVSDVHPANGVVDGKDTNDLVAVFGAFWNGSSWIETEVYKTADVGTRKANPLVIYDMSGNVCEWCWDWAGPYPISNQTDFRGIASGIARIFRGGSVRHDAVLLTCGGRGSEPHNNTGGYSGFRLAKTF
jgi:formylglycine-generating enzyme required for sulfatase activity